MHFGRIRSYGTVTTAAAGPITPNRGGGCRVGSSDQHFSATPVALHHPATDRNDQAEQFFAIDHGAPQYRQRWQKPDPARQARLHPTAAYPKGGATNRFFGGLNGGVNFETRTLLFRVN